MQHYSRICQLLLLIFVTAMRSISDPLHLHETIGKTKETHPHYDTTPRKEAAPQITIFLTSDLPADVAASKARIVTMTMTRDGIHVQRRSGS